MPKSKRHVVNAAQSVLEIVANTSESQIARPTCQTHTSPPGASLMKRAGIPVAPPRADRVSPPRGAYGMVSAVIGIESPVISAPLPQGADHVVKTIPVWWKHADVRRAFFFLAICRLGSIECIVTPRIRHVDQPSSGCLLPFSLCGQLFSRLITIFKNPFGKLMIGSASQPRPCCYRLWDVTSAQALPGFPFDASAHSEGHCTRESGLRLKSIYMRKCSNFGR